MTQSLSQINAANQAAQQKEDDEKKASEAGEQEPQEELPQDEASLKELHVRQVREYCSKLAAWYRAELKKMNIFNFFKYINVIKNEVMGGGIDLSEMYNPEVLSRFNTFLGG